MRRVGVSHRGVYASYPGAQAALHGKWRRVVNMVVQGKGIPRAGGGGIRIRVGLDSDICPHQVDVVHIDPLADFGEVAVKQEPK